MWVITTTNNDTTSKKKRLLFICPPEELIQIVLNLYIKWLCIRLTFC